MNCTSLEAASSSSSVTVLSVPCAEPTNLASGTSMMNQIHEMLKRTAQTKKTKVKVVRLPLMLGRKAQKQNEPRIVETFRRLDLICVHLLQYSTHA
mmetsp:Transcript_4889/g.10415  ORF Transcript_4889/g.10415 Transcript_4889/m.10415 type:complete len:96 (+) Transcript_4889:461-748(+)